MPTVFPVKALSSLESFAIGNSTGELISLKLRADMLTDNPRVAELSRTQDFVSYGRSEKIVSIEELKKASSRTVISVGSSNFTAVTCVALKKSSFIFVTLEGIVTTSVRAEH